MKSRHTHAALVKRAANLLHYGLPFLGKSQYQTMIRCGVVLQEVGCSSAKGIPDVIGWRVGGQESFVIEVKVSRRDFRKDKFKVSRRSDYSVGNWRYYMAPIGLIKLDELPPGWGLIEVSEHGQAKVTVVKEPTRQERHYNSEMSLMYSTILRGAKNGRVKIVGRNPCGGAKTKQAKFADRTHKRKESVTV